MNSEPDLRRSLKTSLKTSASCAVLCCAVSVRGSESVASRDPSWAALRHLGRQRLAPCSPAVSETQSSGAQGLPESPAEPQASGARVRSCRSRTGRRDPRWRSSGWSGCPAVPTLPGSPAPPHRTRRAHRPGRRYGSRSPRPPCWAGRPGWRSFVLTRPQPLGAKPST